MTTTISSIYHATPPPIEVGSTATTISQGEICEAYGPIVRRASDDPSWSLVGVATATGTAEPGGTEPGSSGLSTGAKAGIGVGVAVAGLLLVASGFFAFIARKRLRAAEAERARALQDAATPRPEVKQEEIHGTPLAELGTALEPPELDGVPKTPNH